ncbi:methionine biosynthesis protein MetW [Tessaracoccus lapidicaptus]|jgi:methionine biosynthesis protein MetW|uniref:Methionine biosynthesis protein MetW n=1 Tax=Tessaracoccus lapidicaptus TaxID=1427523 RepID=A0A1C0ANL9_9ACTN|nr:MULTISPECIES: methionine biosynthesis protein MetW [Tessaracoccus]AQX14602.1 methionine biosynthesis protein MetW [Tessaracoccus sp. T2.5-30]OCL34740.1 methionine biosynthesis protein MetW [Tessaracoccus lapidicaptus]VEP38649.1 Ubiquinone biosynthesis O-methyltransferase [Tessaracoccus lapidicaptus]
MTPKARRDLWLISTLIPEGSRVLDLGCGDGELLRLLQRKGCSGTGVDMSPSNLVAAMRSGVDVIQLDLDRQLGEFADDSYDVVVLSRTLQTVRHPRHVLQEIGRIAVHSLVSMPNFAHWRNRLRLLSGRMPMSKDLPFEWYDTPNLHHSSLPDLEPLFSGLGMVIDTRIPLDASGRPHRLGNLAPNLVASSSLYLLHARR